MKVSAYVNGRIYASFKPIKLVDSIVVSGDKIIYIGNSEKAISIVKGLDGDIIDLDNKVVLPGFIDSHMHIDGLAFSLNSVDLRGVRSIDEFKRRIKKFYDLHGEYSWIIGRGWDQELFEEGRLPNRWDLDDIIPDKPALFIRICGHAAVVNTKALEITGFLENPPRSKYFDRDENNNLTGIIFEDAISIFRSKIKYSLDEYIRMTLEALYYIASHGVTTVGYVSSSSEILHVLNIIKNRYGRLPIRIRAYMKHDSLEYLVKLGVSKGFGDDYLKIMGIKLFVDGSLGVRTALLSKPYNDDPNNYGVQVMDIQRLRKLINMADENGLQLAIHAIGDKAIDYLIQLYNELGDRIKINRHRIEHASIVRRDQINKLRDLGVYLSIQPHFIISDSWIIERLGFDRINWIYPFNILYKSNINLGFSTDSPVEPINPWETIYASITRGYYEEIELAKYTTDEKLDLETSLYLYTMGSARLLHMDDVAGSLERGKYADFIILNRDPFEASDKQIKNIRCIATVVGGEFVYKDNRYF